MIYKVFLSIFLFVFSIYPTFGFTDIENNWYKNSIVELEKQGVISGYDDGTFGPENTVSRAEILKIIMNASGVESVEPEQSCFTDVSISSWQAKYICSGVEIGITNGYDDGTFRQGNDVTILETLAFSVRAFGIDLEAETLTPTLSQREREQSEEVWYEKYQKFAHENNIFPIHNYTLDTFASRGQAANIIYRMQQFSQEQSLDYNSNGCGISPGLKTGEYTLDVNGIQREYLLYVPSSVSSSDPKSVIVAFHGRTNDNKMVRDYMKLGGGSYGSTRNQQDFIVAYPAGMGTGPYSWSQYENIQFFDALITEVSENLCINRDAVFSVGHSLGSYMSNKVSCLRGDVIRGMVGVASDGYNGACTGPVTSLITHLPADHLASYQGGLNAYRYKSQQNNCFDVEEEIDLGDIKNCTQKTECSSGNTTIFCNSYTGYGNDPHSWPKDGSDDILEFLRDISRYSG